MFNKQQFEAELILAGFTHSIFAKKLGIDKSTFSKKVNGKSEWTLSEINRIGDIIGVDKIFIIFFAKNVSKTKQTTSS